MRTRSTFTHLLMMVCQSRFGQPAKRSVFTVRQFCSVSPLSFSSGRYSSRSVCMLPPSLSVCAGAPGAISTACTSTPRASSVFSLVCGVKSNSWLDSVPVLAFVCP